MFVHHLAFRTADLATLVAFYRDVLRLPLGRAQPGYSQWFTLGATRLMIERADPGEATQRSGQDLALCLPATPAEQAALEARLARAGVPIEARTPATIYFRDPDGRRLGASTYRFDAATAPTDVE
jgi:catechol 2,3-dioxygenase-like lactoylglutathione lyase family enzyme